MDTGLRRVVQWKRRLIAIGLTAALAVIVFVVGLAFYFAPNADTAWVWITPGSLLATALWVIASYGFKLYAQNFSSYNAVYGAIGSVIVTMLWFYISGFTLLVGAELNADIDKALPLPEEAREPDGRKVIGPAAERIANRERQSATRQTRCESRKRQSLDVDADLRTVSRYRRGDHDLHRLGRFHPPTGDGDPRNGHAAKNHRQSLHMKSGHNLHRRTCGAIEGGDMTHTVRILAIAILTSAAAGSAIVAAEAGEARSQQSTTQAVPRTNGERAEADATQINPVTVDLLHDQAERYLGQTVFLDAEVAEIFGPRLFTVAERNFGATPSLLVVVPEGLAAGVREHDHITLRGTIRRFDPSRFAGQWGWFPLDAATGRRFHGQIVLDASRIGGERVLMLAASTQAPTVAAHEIPPSPTGTAGKPDERSAVVLTDAARVATATDAAIGRSVELQNLGVSGLAAGGFLVNAGPAQLFVLPGAGTTYSPAIGDHVNLQGVLLRVWPGMRSSIRKTARTNGDVYVLATKVSKP